MLNIIYKSVDWSMRQAEQSHCFFTKGTALPPPPPTVAMEMPPNTEPRKCREGGNGSEPSFQLLDPTHSQAQIHTAWFKWVR